MPWTGSGEPINGIVCASGTGDLVGCVSIGWTEGDDHGPIGSVVCTNSSSVCISVPDEPAMWDLLLVVSRPGPGPMNRLSRMVVSPEPVNRLAVSARWSERVEGDDHELIGSIHDTTVSDVCLSEVGELAMWEYVDGIVSPRTGPMNQLVMMIVIPEPVDRLAVLVHAGLGVRYVMPTNRLAVFFVLITVGCVCPKLVNRIWGDM